MESPAAIEGPPEWISGLVSHDPGVCAQGPEGLGSATADAERQNKHRGAMRQGGCASLLSDTPDLGRLRRVEMSPYPTAQRLELTRRPVCRGSAGAGMQHRFDARAQFSCDAIKTPRPRESTVATFEFDPIDLEGISFTVRLKCPGDLRGIVAPRGGVSVPAVVFVVPHGTRVNRCTRKVVP